MTLSIDDVDLFSPETQEDWYPSYHAILDQSPVYPIPGRNMFLVSKFEDIAWIVRNPDRFPHNPTGSHGLLMSDEAKAYHEEHGYPRIQPLSTNPPEHRRYRELVDPFFSPAGATRQQEMITATIEELVDEVVAKGRVEFVEDFAVPLPVRVITLMLGFPLEDIPELRVWSNAWVMPFQMGLSHEEQMYLAEKGVEFQKYIDGFIDERRANPGEDVLSHLAARARYGGDRPFRMRRSWASSATSTSVGTRRRPSPSPRRSGCSRRIRPSGHASRKTGRASASSSRRCCVSNPLRRASSGSPFRTRSCAA